MSSLLFVDAGQSGCHVSVYAEGMLLTLVDRCGMPGCLPDLRVSSLRASRVHALWLRVAVAIVKTKAVSGETDLRWIDARYQIADCLTNHASRKSEAVLQKILQEAQWRITAEEDMLDKRKHEREIRNSSPYDEELWPTSE